MKTLVYFGLLLILIPLFACQNEQPKSKATPPIEKTKKEIVKFHPDNRTVTPGELKQKISNANGKLHIFIFKSPDCTACSDILKHLQTIQADGIKFVINLVIIDDEKEKTGNTNEDYNVYHLENKDGMAEIIPEWSGKLPFILIVNKETATNLSYQQTFSKDELFVVLQSLTM